VAAQLGQAAQKSDKAPLLQPDHPQTVHYLSQIKQLPSPPLLKHLSLAIQQLLVNTFNNI
jgi:hypothetical protein